MENNNFMNTGNEKQTFREIILSYIKQILNLNLQHIPTSAKLGLYIRGVEGLADALIPFYDTQMINEYTYFEDTLKQINKENSDKLRALNPSDYSNEYEIMHLNKLRKAYRELFRKLNLLLHRNDYLKDNVYGEGDSDEDSNEIISGVKYK